MEPFGLGVRLQACAAGLSAFRMTGAGGTTDGRIDDGYNRSLLHGMRRRCSVYTDVILVRIMFATLTLAGITGPRQLA